MHSVNVIEAPWMTTQSNHEIGGRLQQKVNQVNSQHNNTCSMRNMDQFLGRHGGINLILRRFNLHP